MSSNLNIALANPANRLLQSDCIARLSDVKHSWGAGSMLFNVPDLVWQDGAVIWLQGENGSGKSTLMRLMSGLESFQQGDIDFLKIKQGWFGLSARGQICYLHQTPYLFAGTVRKNLEFVLKSLPKSKRAKASARLEEGLDLAALSHLQSQIGVTLSGGERQRLALLRAWLLRPKVLFLDEPAANLDEKSVDLIYGMVLDLIQQGSAVMMSSHQNCKLITLCNQVWKIENGTVCAGKLDS